METSHLIARLLGPVLATVGIGMLTNQAVYREMAEQFLSSFPFIYITGLLALVSGLAILNAHSAWTNDWRSTITGLGWVLCIVGVYRIIGPQFVNFVGTGIIRQHGGFFWGAGGVLLGLGGFLTVKGYSA
jgi:hypothetical protein